MNNRHLLQLLVVLGGAGLLLDLIDSHPWAVATALAALAIRLHSRATR